MMISSNRKRRRPLSEENLNPELINEPLTEEDIKSLSYVDSIISVDSANLNEVKVLKVNMYDTTSKNVVERIISVKTFRETNRWKSAWKKFHSILSCRERKEAPEVIPSPLSPPSQNTLTSLSNNLLDAPRRLRRAEYILSQRTQRIILVLERCYDDFNQQAVMRTAECLGIQHLWLIESVKQKSKNLSRGITRGSHDWISFRKFGSTTECIKALREDEREIWVTELAQDAISLDNQEIKLPKKLALVMGREADGISLEMQNQADKRIYIPMYGFSDSFNLSVATALVLQRLFALCPEARGDLAEEEKYQLRCQWYAQLAKTDKQREEFSHYLNHPPPPLDDVRRDNTHRIPRMSRKLRKKVITQDAEQEKKYLQQQQQQKE